MKDPELEALLIEEEVIETESKIRTLELEKAGLQRRLEETRELIRLMGKLGYDWRTDLEGNEPTRQQPFVFCKVCDRKIYSGQPKFKCCPIHTTEQDDDAVCEKCYLQLHPEEREGAPPNRMDVISELIELIGNGDAKITGATDFFVNGRPMKKVTLELTDD